MKLLQSLLESSGADMVKMLASQYGMRASKIEDIAFKKAPSSKPKQCFDNARKYDLSNPDSTYVIGYLLHRGAIPIEHAWVKDGGKHYDVTIKDILELDEYWALVEIPYDELHDMMINKGMSSPALYDYAKYKRGK